MSVTRARLVTPSDEALTRVAIRYAIALRLGGTAACTVAAPLAGTGVPVALWMVLAVQAVWTGVFAYALPRSPAPPHGPRRRRPRHRGGARAGAAGAGGHDRQRHDVDLDARQHDVARHAGVGAADVRAWSADGAVFVEVTDAGAGFDVGRIPSSRRGIGQSIVGRMAAVGGAATVTGSPGTRVLLRWPGA